VCKDVQSWTVPTKKREPANVEEKVMRFLYKDGDDVVFMDPSSDEQVSVTKQLIGDAADLMTDNLPCRMSFFNERPVGVTLPTFVQLDVIAIKPRVAGNPAAGNVRNKATVETGAVLDVPQFIRVGDTIRVDTRTREYVERVERLDN
jgi:elongation factor P